MTNKKCVNFCKTRILCYWITSCHLVRTIECIFYHLPSIFFLSQVHNNFTHKFLWNQIILFIDFSNIVQRVLSFFFVCIFNLLVFGTLFKLLNGQFSKRIYTHKCEKIENLISQTNYTSFSIIYPLKIPFGSFKTLNQINGPYFQCVSPSFALLCD